MNHCFSMGICESSILLSLKYRIPQIQHCMLYTITAILPFSYSWLTIGRLTSVTVQEVEQELLILLEDLSTSSLFSGIHVAQSNLFRFVFCRSLFVFSSFCFRHCTFCFSFVYGFWLLLRYLQTFLVSLSYFFWPLYCQSFFELQLLITPLVSFGHCIVSPSLTYSFWLLLWYLLAIVLSVLLRVTASDYSFGIFWPINKFRRIQMCSANWMLDAQIQY